MAKKVKPTFNLDSYIPKTAFFEAEEFKPKAYYDKQGKAWTIGYGTNLDEPTVQTYLKGLGYNVNALRSGKKRINEKEGMRFLKDKMQTAYNEAQSVVKNFHELPPDIQYLLTDLSYNMGTPNLRGFKKFRAALENKDYAKAADELENSPWHHQVGRRSRFHEKTLNDLAVKQKEVQQPLQPVPEPSLYEKARIGFEQVAPFIPGGELVNKLLPYAQGGLIKRKDGSYSKRGLWDNIRANIGSKKKPTKEMLRQERKIHAAEKKEDGGDVNPLMNIPESQRLAPIPQRTVTYPEGYIQNKLNPGIPLNFMGQPFASGAIEESISPLDLIGGVKGAAGITKGALKYLKATERYKELMKPNYIDFYGDLIDIGASPRAIRRTTNQIKEAGRQIHKGVQNIVLPNAFEDGGPVYNWIPPNYPRVGARNAQGGWLDQYEEGSSIEDQKIPDTTSYEFGDKFMAYPDKTLTNYQMGTPKSTLPDGKIVDSSPEIPAYAHGATVWTKQTTPSWVAGTPTPTTTQREIAFNTSLSPGTQVGYPEIKITGPTDPYSPSSNVMKGYNPYNGPMRLHAPDTRRMAYGGYVPAYKSGGFLRQAGEFAFGALEGTLDTVTGGMTDSLTDMAHDALAQAAGTTYDDKAGQRLKRLHGAGKIGGAITGAIVSGNVAGAIGQGAEGTNDILQYSPNASEDLKKWGGFGLNLAQQASGFMGGMNNTGQMAKFNASDIGKFAGQAGKAGQGLNMFQSGNVMGMMNMFQPQGIGSLKHGGRITAKYNPPGLRYQALNPGVSAPAGIYTKPTTQRGITFADGGPVRFSVAGENHKVYIKESPTGNGKGVKGHVMVNHPTEDKGKWDTIDLTEKAGAKTVAQGVAATKKWHRENPYYADGGWLNKYEEGGDTSNSVRESTYVQPTYKDRLIDKNNPVEVANSLLRKYNVKVDSTSNILKDIGLPSGAYYNPITRTIHYKNFQNPYLTPEENKELQTRKYIRMVGAEIPHAIQADSLGVLPFLGKIAYEGIQNPTHSRYDTEGTLEHHAHQILQPNLINQIHNYHAFSPMIERMRRQSVSKKKNGGWLDSYDDGGEVDITKPYLNPATVQATLARAQQPVTNTLGRVISTPASREKERREKIIAKDESKYSIEDYKQGIKEPGAGNSVLDDPLAMAIIGTVTGGVGLGSKTLGSTAKSFGRNLVSEVTGGLSNLTNINKTAFPKNIAELSNTGFKKNPYYHYDAFKTKKQEIVDALTTPEGKKRLQGYIDNNPHYKQLNKSVDEIIDDFSNTIFEVERPVYKDYTFVRDEKGNVIYEPVDPDNAYNWYRWGVAKPSAVSMGQNFTPYDAKHVLEHEFAHTFQRGQPLVEVDNVLRNISLKEDKKLATKNIKQILNQYNPFNKTKDVGYSVSGNIYGTNTYLPKYYRTQGLKNAKDYWVTGSGGQEKAAFAAEVRENLLQRGLLNNRYDEITPDLLEKHYKLYDKTKGSKYNLRLYDIMHPTKENFNILSSVLNKMPAVLPAVAVGAQAMQQDNNKKSSGGWLDNL